MRTLLLCLLIFLVPGIGISQHYHFVYIQGENQQTFYLKKSGETLSSSTTGFIILPKLQSGTHQFTVGFPKNQWPEYEFQVEVKSADRGFSLKNFGEKGWGLFDLQTLDIIYGRRIDPPKAEAVPYTPKSDDPFSVILASAVGDPGIRETALVAMKFDKPEPVASKTAPAVTTAPVSVPTVSAPPVTAPPVAKNEPVKPSTQAAPVTESKNQPVTPPVTTETVKTSPDKNTSTQPKQVAEAQKPSTEKPVVSPPVVKSEPVKKEEVKAAPPFESEPVLPSIPVQGKVEEQAGVQTPKNAIAPTRQIRKVSEIRSWKTTELIFLDMNGGVTDTVTVIIEHDAVEPKPKDSTATAPAPLGNRQDCAAMATEKDMLNLRKRVLRLKTEEDMLEATMKDIKAKCYNVEMLQGASYVFVSDRMRYSLFEAAYPHIYDPSNYSKLERLLTSEEFISKFRELIKIK